jgi:hypothetical protein
LNNYASLPVKPFTTIDVTLNGETVLMFGIDEVNEQTGERIPLTKIKESIDLSIVPILQRINIHYLNNQILSEERKADEKVIDEIFEVKVKLRNHNKHIKQENIIGCLGKRVLRSRR